MRINYHYAENFNRNLLDFLLSIGFAKEEVLDEYVQLIVFDIYDDDERLPLIKKEYPNLFSVSWYEFSDEEMEAADWFTLRSKNWKLEPVDLKKTFDFGNCTWIVEQDKEDPYRYYHARQVAPYILSRQVKWSRTHFLSAHTGNLASLFCSDLARSVIERAGLKGCSFSPVLRHRKGTEMPDINQLVFENIIPDDCVMMYKAKGTWHCPVCGKPQYVVDSLSRPIIKLEALGDEDFYSTTNNHAFDPGIIAGPFHIVSKRAYSVIKEHQLTRSLEFFPLLTYYES